MRNILPSEDEACQGGRLHLFVPLCTTPRQNDAQFSLQEALSGPPLAIGLVWRGEDLSPCIAILGILMITI